MFKSLGDTKQARKLALDLSHLAYSCFLIPSHNRLQPGYPQIINDTYNFWPIKGDPTLLREGQL